MKKKDSMSDLHIIAWLNSPVPTFTSDLDNSNYQAHRYSVVRPRIYPFLKKHLNYTLQFFEGHY